LEKEVVLVRFPDFNSGLRILWFALVSTLLGPFALWFILIAKKRRRNIQPAYLAYQLTLALAFLGLTFALFFAPIHWAFLLTAYLMTSGITAFAIHKPDRAQFFQIKIPTFSGGGRFPLRDGILAACMAFYPLVYILALLHNIGEFERFSIHLPSDVYTDGLLWMLYATPIVFLAGIIAWRVGLKPGLRVLVYFYGSVLVVLIWIMVWEKVDQAILNQIYGFGREPLFFGAAGEAKYRLIIKSFFYGGAFLLGMSYLVGAARSNVFIKRAVFLGLPSLLLYSNMLFVIGDWNYYLAGLGDRSFANRHYNTYQRLAILQVSRTPSAYRIPQTIEQWSELEYQNGNPNHAKALLEDLVSRCGDRTYYTRLRKRVNRSLAFLAHASQGVDSSLGKAARLNLPIIKPAAYLDQEWYALLSAVAFLKPTWTDLELKKRLLDLSNTVQLHLPKLDNVPDLVPALRQLEIPVTICFLTRERIKNALAAGHIPFLSLYGHWVPISGYDPGRDGFYYYSYQPSGGWDWFQNEDTDLFYHHAGKAFGGKGKDSVQNFQKFIPTTELEEHIMDIGGVGMVLGDSSLVEKAESRAAFLVEQGDIYYQEHENYEEAAAAYKKAGELFPNDQIYSRMLYLKRKYWEFAADASDYLNLFRDYPPEWMSHLGPDAKKEKEIVTMVMEGKLGSYLMMNWYVAALPDTTVKNRPAMDTAIALFTRLHESDPEEPVYTDSLATLMSRRGNLVASEKLFTELAGLYPFGSEAAEYRLAWTKFKLGKIQELPKLLEKCSGYEGEAKYLTLKGAIAIRKGNFRSAFASLDRSLKLDKSIAETHELLVEYYRHRGDKAATQLHLKWQRRSS
jgi:tetratricopeptide (TPR) repeat protein